MMCCVVWWCVVCELQNPSMSMFLNGLESSGWMRHIKSVIDASVFVAKVSAILTLLSVCLSWQCSVLTDTVSLHMTHSIIIFFIVVMDGYQVCCLGRIVTETAEWIWLKFCRDRDLSQTLCLAF